jgi:tetratricopeptide (TPR) repeat protein
VPSDAAKTAALGAALVSHVSLDTVDELVDAAQQCLSRDDGWIGFYRHTMEDLEAMIQPVEDAEEILQITRAELDFGRMLWAREYADAAKALERGLEQIFAASRPTGAWHALWLGYCYDLLGDPTRARELYERAHRVERNIPPFDIQGNVQAQEGYLAQVLAVVASLRRGTQAHLELPKHFDTELVALEGTGTVPQVEAALEALGEYLGLEA